MTKTICTLCGAVSEVPAHYIGQKVKCTHCAGEYVAQPNHDMTKKTEPVDQFFLRLFKNVWFYVTLVVVAIATLAWSARPSWEERNIQRISDTIREINDDVEKSPVEAWTMWEKLEKELKEQKISSRELKEQIDETQEKMSSVYPKIQKELERLEAERIRVAAALAEAEAERVRLRADMDAREALRKKYRNINQHAKDAVASLKRLQAYTEVGVTKIKYQEALGEAWGSIKVFIESAEAKDAYPELSGLLAKAIQAFKDAADSWDKDEKSMLQVHWSFASLKISEIDGLVNQ